MMDFDDVLSIIAKVFIVVIAASVATCGICLAIWAVKNLAL